MKRGTILGRVAVLCWISISLPSAAREQTSTAGETAVQPRNEEAAHPMVGPHVESDFRIRPENLRIPDDMKKCAENLWRIHAALEKYRKDKGKLPDWLSDLVPDYLTTETLHCRDDTGEAPRKPADPHIDCSYGYPFAAYPLPNGELYRDKTLQEQKIYGGVYPVVRCRNHGYPRRFLNLALNGQVYAGYPFWKEALEDQKGRRLVVTRVGDRGPPTVAQVDGPGQVPQNLLDAHGGQAGGPAGEPGDRVVFEGVYVHRSRGADLLNAALTKRVARDGTIRYSLKMSDTEYDLDLNADGRPAKYTYKAGVRSSGEFQFLPDTVIWKRRSLQSGSEAFQWRASENAWPDFTAEICPYLLQHALVRAYEFAKGGRQSLSAFDVRRQATGLREYAITLEQVDEDGVELPNGTFKARHLVQIETPTADRGDTGAGERRTEYWVNDDLDILRIWRPADAYEVILLNYNKPQDRLAGNTARPSREPD